MDIRELTFILCGISIILKLTYRRTNTRRKEYVFYAMYVLQANTVLNGVTERPRTSPTEKTVLRRYMRKFLFGSREHSLCKRPRL